MSSESATNRAWLIESRLQSANNAPEPPGDPAVLLYYLEQLEAEASRIRSRLGSLGRPPMPAR